VKNIGKDATTAFFGGIYDHSNAAHNVSSVLNIRVQTLTFLFSCFL
jgi:stearoyl-CoA desaturase (delta-9 desaturase)